MIQHRSWPSSLTQDRQLLPLTAVHFDLTGKKRLNFEFSPEMQIGSNVPNMIGTAALQFTAYLARTSLEASIRRRKNKGNSQKSIFRMNPEFQPLFTKHISDYEKRGQG